MKLIMTNRARLRLQSRTYGGAPREVSAAPFGSMLSKSPQFLGAETARP